MSKSRNNVLGVLRSTARGDDNARLLTGTDLANEMGKASAESGLRAGSSGEARMSGLGDNRQATGISFGTAPRTKSGSTETSEWSKLLQQTAANGILSALQSASGLGSFGDLSSLVSGIAGLFGSHKGAPTAPVAFQLPASQNETLTISASSTAMSQLFQDHSADIARAVKTALLHSSSLNDVISEI